MDSRAHNLISWSDRGPIKGDRVHIYARGLWQEAAGAGHLRPGPQTTTQGLDLEDAVPKEHGILISCTFHTPFRAVFVLPTGF